MQDRQKMADGKINADWGFAETLGLCQPDRERCSDQINRTGLRKGNIFS
jgi:hypothetical protein